MNDQQKMYYDLYMKYINSTPNIYGLKFRSRKNDSAAHKHQSVASIEHKPDKLPNVIDCSTIAVQDDSNSITLDTDSNLSAAQQNSAQISQRYHIYPYIQSVLTEAQRNQFLTALESCEFGNAAQVADMLGWSRSSVREQMGLLDMKIEKTSVFQNEWASLVPFVDLRIIKSQSYFHSMGHKHIVMLNTFKAAFKVTGRTKLSLMYTCDYYNTGEEQVCAIVAQSLTDALQQ
ncbi:Hypothetical_protein [Hexamita inflata]|uniref:Hypothetical_protein n=1 Tax=Hexamita inflata TaxID=28002 RepID=A0AA86NAF3_9EUKA|nr:Hypothetical protein HINF_LOCUS3448 [Hexamita inflata]